MQKQDIIIRILGLAYCLNFLELAIVATEFKILFIQVWGINQGQNYDGTK